MSNNAKSNVHSVPVVDGSTEPGQSPLEIARRKVAEYNAKRAALQAEAKELADMLSLVQAENSGKLEGIRFRIFSARESIKRVSAPYHLDEAEAVAELKEINPEVSKIKFSEEEIKNFTSRMNIEAAAKVA